MTHRFLLFILIIPAVLSAAIYDVSIEPEPGDTYDRADFRLYLPDNLDVVRGIYFYVMPQYVDSRTIVHNSGYRQLCEDHDFALMGARLDNMHMDSGIGDAVLEALAQFAILSGHSEVAFSTIFFNGYSWGGQFSYHFTLWNPSRAIGFITQKGGLHDTTAAGEAIHVPGYLFTGELDLDYRIENLTGIFERHRPLGARWCLAMEPRAGHGMIRDQELLNTFFQAVIDRRLPDEIPLDEPVELRPIEEETAWLGNRDRYSIGEYECYNEDPGQASWLITRRVARQWQAFVSDSTITDTIPCGLTRVGSPKSIDMPDLYQLQNYPNPFNPNTTIRFTLPQADNIQLAIYDSQGRLVRCLQEGWFNAGDHRVLWDGTTKTRRAASSGHYFVRLTTSHQPVIQPILLIR
ncbi:MAG: T9SS C-terminal target domain-containing protein [Gemmatimonadetes bacterium]|nr:MAG: T9SS C-terminal target domain-containing protein [Gemmatimonadota bacterium]